MSAPPTLTYYSVCRQQIVRLLHFAVTKHSTILLVQRLVATRKFENRAKFESDNTLGGSTT